MNQLIEIGSIFIQSIFSIIKAPIFWILILILYLQYNRLGKIERKVLGGNKQSIYERIVYSTLSGILGGVLGSIIMLILRITVEIDDFGLIFILALLLMLINPRFLCFSYSGGIVSLVSLIFGYPDIDVSSIMAIVAILHLIESFLIRADGYKTRIPMFIDREGATVGGFNMIRYWPVPFIILMPSNQTILMGGVIAALGYGDMAFTEYPKNKAIQSSKHLFVYSMVLLALSVLSAKVYFLKFIAALFAPSAHEFLIQYSRKKERSRKPIFTPVNNGVRVLETKRDGVAEKLGIKMGDVILSINGIKVGSVEQMRNILNNIPSYIWIDYYNRNGQLVNKDYCDYKNGIKDLGILVVPKYSPYVFDIDQQQGFIIKAYKWVKRKLAI